MSAPGVRFRPPTGAIQKSSFHRYLQYYLAIIYLIRPASRPRIFVPHAAPWFPCSNPAPRSHRLRTPAAVVSPGPRPKHRPARGNFGLAARIFHPRLRAGNCCAASRLHPRPDPSGASPRGLLPRRPATPEKGRRRWSGYTIANLTEQKRGRSRKPASQEPPPAYSYRVSSGFAEPREPPGFTHWPAPYPAIPAAGPAPVRTVFAFGTLLRAGGGAPRSAAGTSTSYPCSVLRHWPA